MNEAAQLNQTVKQLRSENDQLRTENNLLRQKLDALARRLFGKKSEQLNPAQLELLLAGIIDSVGDPEVAEQDEEPDRPRRRERRRNTQRVRAPEDLEVVREVIEPELVTAEPAAWKRIGQEVSRRLDYQPGKFFWQETVRPKYVRVDDRSLPPLVAPAIPQVIEGGLPAPGLLAQILVSRFCDHLPYYRQSDIFAQRLEVHIPRQQMVQWVAGSVRLLSGITDVILGELRQSTYVQVDETPIKYQNPDHPGGCSQGYLWTGLLPGKGVYYQWHTSRAAGCVEQLLGKHYCGHLQCDGYSAYPVYARSREDVQLVGCWAHARRYIFEARQQEPRRVGILLQLIGQLYRWEAQLRKSRAGPRLREAERNARARPVLKRLRGIIDIYTDKVLPQSLLGKALTYARNQWEQLEQFVTAGQVEIDNNLVENAIRPTAVGKKNWLFMGSAEAGERNAVIYTLMANCRMHGIEPYGYLKDVLTRLPTTSNQEVDQLTPLNWQKNRHASRKAAA
jgi:transposase